MYFVVVKGQNSLNSIQIDNSFHKNDLDIFTVIVTLTTAKIYYYYYYCGRVESEHNIEPVGPVRGWAKAHLCINPNLTCGLRSEDGKQIDPSSESPKNECTLGNASIGHLHQKIVQHGKHQRRASKRREEISGEGSHHLHIQYFAPT